MAKSNKAKTEILKASMPVILNKLEEQFATGDVITFSEASKLLKENEELKILSGIVIAKEFIKFLLNNNILKKFKHQRSKNYSTPKYAFKDVLKYKTPIRLRKNSYLSHYSAVFLHGLTENVPKNVYCNKEQSKKPQSKNKLTQSRIDYAFSKTMKKTNHMAVFDSFLAYLIAGKNVDETGVTNIKFNDQSLPITDIERTLIDITVRPGYAGGVEEVLEAYKKAQKGLSVNKLLAYLRKMNFTYPYHQAIGFYLEKSGYDNYQISLVEKLDKNYKFYLTYNMDDPLFSDKWRLFYPQHL